MPPFELVSEFEPRGDQPRAIAELVEGVEQNKRQQILLGATGTGKSIGWDDAVFVVEERDGKRRARVLPIGELIDTAIEVSSEALRFDGDSEILDVDRSETTYYAQSFDPATGYVDLYPIRSFVRHHAPDPMYRLKTTCGRHATLTGDHNLWVLRDGDLRLIDTADALPTDYIPLPETLLTADMTTQLDVLEVLAGRGLFVDATDAVLAYTEVNGVAATVQAMSSSGVASPYSKLSAMRRDLRGRGINLDMLRNLLVATDNLGGYWLPDIMMVGGKKSDNRLPCDMKLSPEFLRLVGYYISEGNCQERYIILANYNDGIRADIEECFNHLGIPFSVRPNSDYQVSSSALAELLGRLCGHGSHTKRLLPFWPELSDDNLALVLRAYFDGDGTVGHASDITATTASAQLASDLLYALMRFGIRARWGQTFKRATNNNHAGAWYHKITISGQDNLLRYHNRIGFSLEYKRDALERQMQRPANSNVDVVPIDGQRLRWLRNQLGMTAKMLGEAADLSRAIIQLYENNQRHPSRSSLRRVLDALREVVAISGRTTREWMQVWSHLDKLCQLRWTKIEVVEPVNYDQSYVYDFCVPGVENFLAGHGGFFVHNTYTVANIVQTLNRPTLVLAHNKTLAAQLYAEFKEFFPKNAVEYYVSYYDYYQPESYVPRHDLFIEKQTTINEQIERLRIASKAALVSRRDVLIVASVSCIYGTGDPTTWAQTTLRMQVSDTIRRERILRELVRLQYKRNDMDLQHGTFRARGDTLEVFPIYANTAYRISLFDEEVERITEFDPLTGEVIGVHESIVFFPATQFVADQDKLQKALHDIEQELEQQIRKFQAEGKLLEAQRIEQRTQYDLEMLREMGFTSGIENYSRHLEQRPVGSPPHTLVDYFPDDYLLVIDESHMTIPQLNGMYNGDRARKETLVEYGFRLPSAVDNRPLKFSEFEDRMGMTIHMTATPGPYEREHAERTVQQIIRPTGVVDPQISVRPVKGQIDDLLQEVALRVKNGQRAFITTLTQRMAEELSGYLNETGIKAHHLHAEINTLERVEILRDLRIGIYDAVVGINLLREGIDMPEVSLVAILDADKEGFLRSDTALIQIIGRAARHIEGQVIMYADRMTDSMQRAIDETNRRREIQEAYNKEHGIEPKSIIKQVRDLTDRVKAMVGEEAKQKAEAMPEGAFDPALLSKSDLSRMIHDIEEDMKAAARALEFEKAAMLRDQMVELKGILVAREPEEEDLMAQ